jgi:hypothetical protein
MARIGNLDISWKGDKQREVLAAKPATQPKAGKVDTYYAPSSKAFSTYKNVAGDASLTYDILEGLYRRTIMRRIIDKPAQDATRLGYTMHVLNQNGDIHEKAEQICHEITKMIRRRSLKTTYRDQKLYGDAFLYQQLGSGNPSGIVDIEQIYSVNPRYIEPDIDNNQQLKGWIYNSSAKGQVNLNLEDICHIPNNPLTGQLYGNSSMESVLQVLNLMLNSQLSIAVIIDKIATPFIHWLIDSKHEKRKTPLTEILTFIKNLGVQSVGNDIVTDSSITTEIIGAGNKLIDFSPILDKLEQTFYVTSGIPGQILGMPADNLSAITRQLQTYYEDLFDFQESTMDYLISDIYEPALLRQGIDDYMTIYASYSKPMIEQESRIAVWTDIATKDGAISLQEMRAALGYNGSPPPAPEVIDSKETTSDVKPELDKKQNQKKPAGTSPK